MKARTGQAPGKVDRAEFSARFRARFVDPRFRAEDESIARLEALAWEAFSESDKAPRTRDAGEEFADPKYHLSLDWLVTRDRLKRAAAHHASATTPSRVLLVCGSPRNDKTCPGEMSKSFRLVEIARATFESEGVETDVLDLSLVTSDYGRQIHPCKGCVSTAMPLCHWPCSCYPNHALGQVHDWMHEIYERWTLAHGVVIVTPVHWYQSPSVLKLMMDRLVCADGGNPDPTRTSGKNAVLAKKVELEGWDYPKHLAGRAYGVLVHGDAEGVDAVRSALSDWLDTMGLVDAGHLAKLQRLIGYYEPYATSHDALDRDEALMEETRNVARAVTRAIRGLRAGELLTPDADLNEPRPK